MGSANPALPGGTNSPLSVMSKTDYVLGLVVDQDNLLDDAESDRNAIADVFAGIVGSYNCQVSDFPVTIVPDADDLSFVVGGYGQKMFVQGRLADYIPAVTFTPGAASGVSTRIDGLFVQYNLYPTGGRSQTIIDSGGHETSANVPDNYESVTWNYVAGTPGGTVPATPAGFELFAEITIGPGATTCTAAIQFPTVDGLLLSGGVVNSINGVFGALLLQGGAGVDVSTEDETIVISLGGGLVASVNDLGGNVVIEGSAGVVVETTGGIITISSGDTFTGENGITVTTTDDGGDTGRAILISGTTVNGFSGAVSFTAGPGVSMTSSGNTVTFSANLVAGNGIAITTPGDGTKHIAANLQAGTNITITPSGGALVIAGTATSVGQIGSTSLARTRITGGGPITITLPYELAAGGEWLLIATAYCDLGSGHTMTLTGGGTGSITWEGPSSVGDQPGIEQVQLDGFTDGASTPSVTLTFPSGAPDGAYNGLLTLMAVRVS